MRNVHEMSKNEREVCRFGTFGNADFEFIQIIIPGLKGLGAKIVFNIGFRQFPKIIY